MATTSIWPVKGYLGKVVVYIENPEKTETPAFYEKQNMTDDERGSLADVIEYAANENKTAMRRFVSGVNCSPETAREEMMVVKQRYEKEGGRVGFHGYQSFAQGEVTPELAHEIGVSLAEELWGKDFQVVVATHLDHKNHIHNHFVFNSVAKSDGHRFVNFKKDYQRMRDVSDRLCREYGLSVIEKPVPGKSKHYSEWRAEKNGKPTWRSVIKADIDEAVISSMTDTQFYSALRNKGYEIKIGKDISVRPPGKDRFFRLARNFGGEYTQEAIRKRILSQSRPYRIPKDREYVRRRSNSTLSRKTCRKVGGFTGLYLYYQYLLGNFPKRGKRPRRNSFALKADIAKMDRISAETRLLCKNRIETDAQLSLFRSGKEGEIESLMKKRDDLRKSLRREPDITGAEAIREEIAGITKALRELRREVRLADDISERSGVIRENIKTVNEKQSIEKYVKEAEKNELCR